MQVIHSWQKRGGRGASLALALAAALVLGACGGGGDEDPQWSGEADTYPEASVPVVSGTEDIVAVPTFHLAPVELAEPDISTGLASVHSQEVAPGLEQIATNQLLPSRLRKELGDAQEGVSGNMPFPLRSLASLKVVTYTPQQTRAAYKLPAVGSVAPTTAAARAALGAGQTIYIVNAYHHPNLLSDLAAYNRQFGLPGCAVSPVSTTAKLPLAPASASAGCTLSVVYSTPSGQMTGTVPAYNQAWATEITMDVQQAHAIAPLARLVLIEARDATLPSLAGAIALANRMGPGVVSMSFGAGEGSWSPAYDGLFSAKGMQYTAAAGDSGVEVNWPAVSPRVLAVAGTTLTYNGSTRSETTWAKTGGGTSRYFSGPAYQAALKTNFRRVADVSFNSDPYTGQYIAFTPSGGTLRWFSGGGTSIAAPAWAGLLAVTNAQRQASNRPALNSLHNALYLDVFASPAKYAASFLDVRSGSHGTCAACAAVTGYDNPTGMGTPNAPSLWSSLSASTR